MGTDNFSRQAFEAWLKIDKNQNIIRKIADKTYRRMEMNRLNLPGVDIRLTNSDEEIYQESMLFLLENEGVRKDLIAGGPAIMNRLQSCLWHRMLDISRSAEGNQDIYKDTRRLLYRHIFDVMGSSDKFVKTKISSREIVFGLTHTPPRAIVLIEDLMDIGYPQDLPSYFHALNTKKNILELAEYFWNQAAQKTQEPHIQISVRDFMSWIGKYVNLSNTTDSYTETNDDNPLTKPLAKEKQAAPEDVMKKRYLTVWANNFYHLLKEIEKEIFYYYECEKLRHKDVAELMGKKGNLSYRRDKIRDKLKDFLIDLHWLSPEPGMKQNDPADFKFFLDNLCSLLSAAIEGR